MSTGFMFTAYTYSPLHAGVGQAMGAVDLPIEREKHTNYPCVFATGVKGALRAHFKKNNTAGLDIDKIFGPEGAAGGGGGAIFTDLKLLLFPVRSSEGAFKWITSLTILNRFKRDLSFCNNSAQTTPEFKVLKPLAVVPNIIDPFQHLILEDFIFETPQKTKVVDTKEVKIENTQPSNTLTEFFNVNRENIFIVDDDVYKHLVTNATQVIARNKLDNESKTSENLWYEEFLPTDTLLYSFIKLSFATQVPTAEFILFQDSFKNLVVQIGGGETVGYGIVEINSL